MIFYILKHSDIKKLAVLKKGFSWPAFFFGTFWAAIYDMWLVAGILFIITYGLKLFNQGLVVIESPFIAIVLMLIGIATWLVPGFLGNVWRLHYLKKDGFELVDVIKARSIKDAELLANSNSDYSD